MNITKPTIVVFGCTGTVGAEVTHALSKENCVVRGVLRNPDRFYPVPPTASLNYVSASLQEPTQLRRACATADTVFLLTGTAPDQVANETNIIDAAIAVGVTRIVKLSAPVVVPSVQVEVSTWHRQIEAVLDQSNIDYCVLRPYAFMQNWERNTFTMRRFGKIFGAMGEASRNYIDCRDVAEVAVHYLLSDKSLNGQAITLSGPEAITNADMASRFSYVTNSKIEYINLTKDALYAQLTKRAKLPKWLAHHIVELDNLAVKVPEPVQSTTEQITGRKPRIMDAYLQEARHLFRRKPLWKFWGK